MLKAIRNFCNGLAIGIIQIVPGISGATIAIMLGFYFELIEIINNITRDIKKSIGFLAPFIMGMVCGLLVFGTIMNFFLTNFSFPSMLFFIGLISGITPHIYAKIKQRGIRIKINELFLIIIPFVLLITVSFFGKNAPSVNPDEIISNIGIPYMVFIFFAGIISSAALVIPGVSGTFFLLLLGIYPLAIHTISMLRIFLSDMGNTAILLDICRVLLPLGAGILAGVFLMARLIENLLRNHEKSVYSVILGLILGSICLLFRQPIVYQSGVSAIIIIAGIVTFALGCVLSFALGKKRL